MGVALVVVFSSYIVFELIISYVMILNQSAKPPEPVTLLAFLSVGVATSFVGIGVLGVTTFELFNAQRTRAEDATLRLAIGNQLIAASMVILGFISVMAILFLATL